MEANIELAKSLFKKNKFQEAINACKKILANDKNSTEALKLIAKSFFSLRQIDDTRLYLNQALAIKPDDFEAIKDLGNTFQAVGDINNAKKYYQKAIKINSCYAPALNNLGCLELSKGNISEALDLCIQATESDYNLASAWANIATSYSKLNKLEKAEEACLKSIEINPNVFNYHQFLSTVLIEQNKLKEAEQPLRKTIELNPKSIEAHNNLGNILKNLGKLKEAENSYLKAKSLNPESAELIHNLGNTLMDLGKLEELIILSKSTLKLNSLKIGNGDKLLANLKLCISNLIKGNFSELFFFLNQVQELINKGAIDSIKSETDKKHTLSFYRFMSSLYPQLKKETQDPFLERIPHFGESHCLSFAQQTLNLFSKRIQVQPVLVTGGKAWHFAEKKNNRWKSSLEHQMKKHPYSDKAFISFGEIDCRKEEGILNYAITRNKNITEVCKLTIKGYLDYLEAKLSLNYSKRFYFGVAAPLANKELSEEMDIERIKLIRTYNSLLKKEVLSRGSYFLDVYSLTSSENGENNRIHMCDGIHLSPECVSILFENYLYEPLVSPTNAL